MRMRMQTHRGQRSAAGKMEPAGVVQGAGETVRGKEEQCAKTVRGRRRVQSEGETHESQSSVVSAEIHEMTLL